MGADTRNVLNLSDDSKDPRAKFLGNLAWRPLVVTGVRAQCVDGFAQALRFNHEDPRRAQALTLSGNEARAYRQHRPEGGWAYWDNRRLVWGSPEHLQFLEAAVRASFLFNPVALALLFSTRGTELIYEPETLAYVPFPGERLCRVLESIRDEGKPEIIAHQMAQLRLIRVK